MKLDNVFLVAPVATTINPTPRHAFVVKSCGSLAEAVDCASEAARTSRTEHVIFRAIRLVQTAQKPVEIINLETGEVTS